MSDASSSSSSERAALPVRSSLQKPTTSATTSKRERSLSSEEDVIDLRANASSTKRGSRGGRGGVAPEVTKFLKQAELTHAMEPREFLTYLENRHKKPYGTTDEAYQSYAKDFVPCSQRVWPVMRRMPDMTFVQTRPPNSFNPRGGGSYRGGDRSHHFRGGGGGRGGREYRGGGGRGYRGGGGDYSRRSRGPPRY